MTKRKIKAPIIVIEGIDGAGKTTVTPLIAEYLAKLGWGSVETTREPWNDEIRSLMKSNPDNDEFVSALAYADRVLHVNWMRDRTDKGIAVICDRFWPSTEAYQKDARPTPLNTHFIEVPMLYILLRVNPVTALNRIGSRGNQDGFESLERLQKAAKAYEDLFRQLGSSDRASIAIIDADAPIDKVSDDVRKTIYLHIPRNSNVRCSTYK